MRTARLPQRRNRTLLGDVWLARMDEISRGISRSPARATQFHPVDIGQKPLDQTLRAIGGLPHLLLCRSSVHQHARLVGPRSRVGRGICPAGLMRHSVPATSQDLPTSSPRWGASTSSSTGNSSECQARRVDLQNPKAGNGSSTLRRVPVKKLSGQMTFGSPPQQTLAEVPEESVAPQLGSDQGQTGEAPRKDCPVSAFCRCLQLSLTQPHTQHVQCPSGPSKTRLRG